VPNVLKSGSLNFLKLSGPVQACNGFALPYQQQWEMRKTEEPRNKLPEIAKCIFMIAIT
jgi:hypothetical protein